MDELRDFLNGLSPTQALKMNELANRFLTYRILSLFVKAGLVALFLFLKFS